MTAATLFQSILASLPEIVVVTGACILLILGQLVPKGQGYFLVWASAATVLVATLATLLLAGEVRPAYSGMFIADRFAVFFKMVFYLSTILTFLLSRKYAEIEEIALSEYYVLLLFALSGMM
ncbi:MAG: NADH-quinone oxidoreductase subunit N, partial [Mesorhizobium sp.]